MLALAAILYAMSMSMFICVYMCICVHACLCIVCIWRQRQVVAVAHRIAQVKRVLEVLTLLGGKEAIRFTTAAAGGMEAGRCGRG